MDECEQATTLQALIQADGPLHQTLQALGRICKISHLNSVACSWRTRDGNCVELILNRLSPATWVGYVEHSSTTGPTSTPVKAVIFTRRRLALYGVTLDGAGMRKLIEKL